MFKFLQRRREAAADAAAQREAASVLSACEAELNRTARANWKFVTVPRDISTREQLLQKADLAGLGDHETVKRLDFLHRLLACLVLSFSGHTNPAVKDGLLSDANRYQLGDADAVKTMAALRELELLGEHGASPIEVDPQGRAVYLRCPAEFKNKAGQLEVREDGVTFTGEVMVEISWSNVVHAAKTSHSYQGVDYRAIAFQEGKRRTPTKFAITDPYRDVYACEVAISVWAHNKTVAPVETPPTTKERSRSKKELPADHPRFVGVVGESHYQDTLQKMLAVASRASVTVEGEPTNPHDKDAVRIANDAGETVGYLARGQYTKLKQVARARPLTCGADLRGGTPDRPTIGIVLDLGDAYPADGPTPSAGSSA